MIPKWKMFVWKIMNRAIAIKSNLCKRGMMMEANCVLCKESQENDNHLFRDCPISSHTWKASSLGINVYANQHVGVREWIKNFLNLFWKEDGYNSPRVIIFKVVLWSIW